LNPERVGVPADNHLNATTIASADALSREITARRWLLLGAFCRNAYGRFLPLFARFEPFPKLSANGRYLRTPAIADPSSNYESHPPRHSRTQVHAFAKWSPNCFSPQLRAKLDAAAHVGF
jgi:hypothetical protein